MLPVSNNPFLANVPILYIPPENRFSGVFRGYKMGKLARNGLSVKVRIVNKVSCTLHFNPFVPNAPFLYPLKTSENRKLF